jgi:hypothetical protein
MPIIRSYKKFSRAGKTIFVKAHSRKVFDVMFHSKQIGSSGPKKITSFSNRNSARVRAERMNRGLSSGEKSYYGMRYRVKRGRN